MPGKPRRHNIQEELAKWLSRPRRVALAGIGNPIRMDDFLGVKIIQNLKGKLSENVLLIECETVPEGYIEQIIQFDPTHILLIDTAILGLKPGESELVEPEAVPAEPAFSSHILPLRIFCEYLAKSTKARIALLLIQPKETEFGEGLSPEADAAARVISAALLEALSRKD